LRPPCPARASAPYSTSARRPTAALATRIDVNLAEVALRPGRDPARADRPAVRTASGPVTNAAFQAMVAAQVAELLRAGLRPGDKVLLRMTNSAEFAAAFLA